MVEREEVDRYADTIVAECRSLARDEVCRAILLRCRDLLRDGVDFELVLEVERSAMEQLGVDSHFFFGKQESGGDRALAVASRAVRIED